MKIKNNKSKKRNTEIITSSDYKPYLISYIISLIITSFMLVIMAFIITIKDIPHSLFPFMSIFSVAIGAFFGGFSISKIIKKNGFLNGLILGVIISISIYIVSTSLNGISATYILYIKTVVIICLSTIGGIVGINFKKRNRI